MGHCIVCGLGQVGFRVVRLLRRLGESVTVITENSREDFLREVTESGAKVITGDARNDQHLVEAGISHAKTVIACISNDLANIGIAMDAARLNPSCRIVIRMFDQGLASHLTDVIGIDRTVSMSAAAAPAFAASALGEAGKGLFSHNGRTYEVVLKDGKQEVIEIERLRTATEHKHTFWHKFQRLLFFPAAIWTSVTPQLKTIATLILALVLISVVAFQFVLHLSLVDALYFVITTVTTTGYGDITPKDFGVSEKILVCALMILGSAGVATFYSILTDYLIRARFNQMLGQQDTALEDHVILIGLGNLGFRTANELRQLGLPIVVVDLESDTEFRSQLDRRITFMVGDGRDKKVLQRAGVARAASIISATSDDAMNLSIGLAAKAMNPNLRLVIRLFDDAFATKVKSHFPVHAASSASKIAAPVFVTAALYPDSVHAFVEENCMIMVCESRDGYEVKELPLAPGN